MAQDLEERFQRALDLHRKNLLAEADAEYRAVLIEDPHHINALQLRGAIRLQEGDFPPAVAAIRAAILLDPARAHVYCNLGETFRRQARLDDAVRTLKHALKIEPDHADSLHNLGGTLIHQGEIAAGRDLIEQAIRLTPRPIYYYTLADAGAVLTDQQLGELQSLAESPDLLPGDRGALHVTLGRALNARGNRDEGFRHLLEGNRLRRAATAYDEDVYLGLFDRVASSFPADIFKTVMVPPAAARSPIFVIGMPRSGTTLVEQILASHSGVHGAGELDFLSRVVSEHCSGGFPETVKTADQAALLALGDDYRGRLAALDPDLRVVDKMPMNFFYCGLIALAMPDARIIHMVRDPIDTCLSCFSIMFGGALPFTTDLAELGRYYRRYHQLMEHWRKVLPPGILLDVRYEELVGDQEGQTRRLLDHCGLEWEEACLSYHETDRPVATASTSQVRRPINRSGIRRWRPSEALLAPLLAELGDRAQELAAQGQALAQTGQHPEAIEAYRSALALNPHYLEAVINLTASLAVTGAAEAAEGMAKGAVGLAPGHVDALGNLARLALRIRDQGTALGAAKRALAVDAWSSGPLTAIASELIELGLKDQAAPWFRAAVVVTPNLHSSYSSLSALLTGRIDRDEAAANARRAVVLQPYLAALHHGAASCEERRGAAEAALQHILAALSLRPADAEFWAEYSNIAMVLGEMDVARAAVRRALALCPDQPRYHRALSVQTRWREPNADVAAMQALLPRLEYAPPRDRAELHFALAKVHEDQGDANRQFDHLLTGNALMRQTFQYDERAPLALFAALRKIVTRDYLTAHANSDVTSDVPIFIVGMPRSGTTLAEQILSSHSQVFGAGENARFSQLLHRRLRQRVQPLDQAIAELSTKDLAEMGKGYVAYMEGMAPGARHVVDKMPANAHYAGLLHLAMPHAKIIRMRRDPVDNCLSCFANLFSDGQEFSYGLAELGRYYHAHEALMDHWREVLPADAYMEVQYEDLVSDFETQVRRILSFCGLNWQDACLSFHQTKRAVRTASVTQVRQPLYSSSIGKQRPDAEKLRPLLDAL